MEAEVNAVAGEKLDTAYAAGVSYGAASAARAPGNSACCTRRSRRTALFGQLIDSDFGDGNTDSKGFVIRGGYTVARNWTINATLFLNELSNDVSADRHGVQRGHRRRRTTRTVITGVFDREYKRLQLDLNFRF